MEKENLSAFSARPRLRLLLDHFSTIKDTRQAWKVAYPLREVLFLVVCGTIALAQPVHRHNSRFRSRWSALFFR